MKYPHFQMPEFVFLTAWMNNVFRAHLMDLDVSQVYEKPLQDSQVKAIFADYE